MTDIGPQFVADEFATFMKMNGIKHIRCAPYHPSSNGAMEGFVQTFKRAMKARVTDCRYIRDCQTSCWHTAPHTMQPLTGLQVNCSWDMHYVPDWISSDQLVTGW